MGSDKSILDSRLSRRRFLAASAITAGAAAVSLGIGECDPALIRRIQQAKDGVSPHHRVWVWQFSSDGDLESLASLLSGTGIGVMLKTHDGLDWMSKYDHALDAITSPDRVRNVGRYFEERGVPFHTWCVVKGIDPLREAQMLADTLAAGARSVTIDLEGGSGFWSGSPGDAAAFGNELRRLSPFGRVDISIDPRPWRINLVPMPEFVAFTDGIWPQLYWDTFNTPGNHDGYRNSGFPVPAGGTTPEFLLESTRTLLEPYGREIIPAGQGAAVEPASWARFAHRAWDLQMTQLSVWRLGVTRRETIDYLAQNPPGPEPQAPPPTPTTTATETSSSPTKSPTKTKTPTKTPTKTKTPTPAPATGTPTPTAAPSLTPTFTPTV